MEQYLQSIGLNQTEITKVLSAVTTLRAYTFQRVTERGSTENVYCSADNLLGDYTSFKITLTFQNFESAAEKTRGSAPSSQAFVLRLADADFWREAIREVSNNDVGKSTLQMNSDAIWNLALEKKFIEDWSTFDESGKRLCVLKSLSDLGAEQV